MRFDRHSAERAKEAAVGIWNAGFATATSCDTAGEAKTANIPASAATARLITQNHNSPMGDDHNMGEEYAG